MWVSGPGRAAAIRSRTNDRRRAITAVSSLRRRDEVRITAPARPCVQRMLRLTGPRFFIPGQTAESAVRAGLVSLERWGDVSGLSRVAADVRLDSHFGNSEVTVMSLSRASAAHDCPRGRAGRSDSIAVWAVSAGRLADTVPIRSTADRDTSGAVAGAERI
jgi:hypothetical protein